MNTTMNTILLQPTDVLFFRDGRPMTGASSGHGAAWPLPTVTDASLHAALHRAGEALANKSHKHCHDHEGNRSRPFGSVTHAGPFPVYQDPVDQDPEDRNVQWWYFPRPLDLLDHSLSPALLPLVTPPAGSTSSLPSPLQYSCANRLPPNKDSEAKGWLSRPAWERYIRGETSEPLKKEEAKNDHDFADTEHTIGIGIDPASGTQDGEQFYSAQYLRLREGWRLGLIAGSREKQNGDANNRIDILRDLFPGEKNMPTIIVGGQQRICTAQSQPIESALPMPQGMSDGFQALPNGQVAVKWVLLTPAVFPFLPAATRKSGHDHPGGWLPSWVDPSKAQVELLDGPGGKKARRLGQPAGQPIAARLVAAVTGKPIPVTGWALAHEAAGRDTGGAKPSLLAVPAGSVYYFEAEDSEAARKLAAALNWHGDQSGEGANAILNRRSALLGEKGFGLGVCGSWQPYANAQANPSTATVGQTSTNKA